MKNDYTLNGKLLKPKQMTVEFLLRYSKNLQVLKTVSKIRIVSKN
ncbi:hypothetical protein SAMN05421638_1205 [Kaistella treverensis]|uniref:Uncharacterized protein n=1 Tax=Kaistella treverensis TaxID=631455 RepID=A0A1I3LL51_9FLAO|nr:hypothetical protein [Kaistella treverensis]SFI85433.1 hypothetical protein SAMN05421638_1205 [Kaistella treverensis]